MHAGIIAVGIMLAGQVGGSDGRYAPVVPPSTSTADLGNPLATTQPSATQAPTQPTTSPPATTQSTASQPQATQTPLTGSGGAGPRVENSAQTNPPPVRRPAASSAPATGLTKVVKPVDLLRSLVQSTGQPQSPQANKLPLSEAVQGAQSRREQSERVRLYWQLSRAVSDFRLAALEAMHLQTQRNGLLQPSADWTTALQAANGRKQIASAAVKIAQLRLHQAMGRSGEAALPLPTDLPHCGAYQTKYDQIFQGRGSPEARQLVDLLSMRHKQLAQASADTSAALQWHRLVSQQRGAQTDDRLLLKAYEQLALQRRAFVAAAYSYNQDIARYTDLAVPQEVGTVRLVAMLIQPSGAASSWQSGGIQRASVEESADKVRSVDRYKPKTFAGGPDDQEQPASTTEEGSERSILVSPDADSR
ncbi:MAG: hypothetical protein AAGD11_06645 [Planctomycetota bacterium]